MHLGYVVCMLPVHGDDLEHCVFVLFVTVESALDAGDFGACDIGGSGEQGGNRRRPCPRCIGVIGHRQTHHQRTEICIT